MASVLLTSGGSLMNALAFIGTISLRKFMDLAGKELKRHD